jgi:hypothetical protein
MFAFRVLGLLAMTDLAHHEPATAQAAGQRSRTPQCGSHHKTLSSCRDPFIKLCGFRGKQIVEAHLGLWNSYSATCGNRALDVYSASLASVATRWVYSGPGTHSQPPIAATKSGSTTGSKGQASCAEGYIYTPDHALDTLVQGWADTTSGQVGMGLIAPSETDVSYFKSVRSGDATSGKPFMYVTYNSPITRRLLPRRWRRHRRRRASRVLGGRI